MNCKLISLCLFLIWIGCTTSILAQQSSMERETITKEEFKLRIESIPEASMHWRKFEKNLIVTGAYFGGFMIMGGIAGIKYKRKKVPLTLQLLALGTLPMMGFHLVKATRHRNKAMSYYDESFSLNLQTTSDGISLIYRF